MRRVRPVAGSVLIWVPVPWYGALIYGKLGHYPVATELVFLCESCYAVSRAMEKLRPGHLPRAPSCPDCHRQARLCGS
jgi:hypothetical protein